LLAVLLSLGDPGITIDEPLDVRVGDRYVQAIGRWIEGKGSPLRRGDVELAFAGTTQHPPLGRVLVGAASSAFGPIAALLGFDDAFGVHPARLAPALAFGMLVGLVAGFAARRSGMIAGAAAAVAMLFTPRLFAHAHFATLESILNLFWVGTLLGVAWAVEARRPVLALGASGLIWGLALLTKIHAWLLPPLVLAWTLARLGLRRGWLGWLAWLGVGLVVLFAGWPWLWYDPAGRLRAFLGTSVERLALRVEYFGHLYLDRDVPWHYPWFYFAATVPVGLHALGIVGLVDAWRGRREDAAPFLFLGAIVLLLVVFSTNAPVYDGERLFLPVFPLWTMFVGRGFGRHWKAAGVGNDATTLSPRERVAAQPPGEGGGTPDKAGEREPAGPASSLTRPLRRHPLPRGEGKKHLIRAFLAILLITQAWGLVRLHPFQLSYYNALVGGLPGASRLGLEMTYWGDAVDRRLLDTLAARVRPGQVAALVPTLHHIQAVAATTPALANGGTILQDQAAADRADWLVVYRRTAYWPEEFGARLQGRPPVAANVRQGVWLAAIWDTADRQKPTEPIDADP
jgi:hypothetical protein